MLIHQAPCDWLSSQWIIDNKLPSWTRGVLGAFCLSPSKQRKGQTSHNLLGGQLLVPIPPPLIPEITGSSTQGAVTDFYQPVQRPRSDDVLHTEVKVQTRRLHLKRVKRIRSVRSLGTNRVTLSDLFAGFAASHPASCGGTGEGPGLQPGQRTSLVGSDGDWRDERGGSGSGSVLLKQKSLMG